MGERGPNPTPTNILELRGSWRAASRRASGEPDCALLDRDDPPQDLPEILNKYWLEYVPLARSLRVMTYADVPMMIDICRLAFMRDLAWEDMVKNGQYSFGGEIERPCVKTFFAADTKIEKKLAKFGLSPSDRTRVRASSPVQEKKSGVMTRKAAGA